MAEYLDRMSYVLREDKLTVASINRPSTTAAGLCTTGEIGEKYNGAQSANAVLIGKGEQRSGVVIYLVIRSSKKPGPQVQPGDTGYGTDKGSYYILAQLKRTNPINGTRKLKFHLKLTSILSVAILAKSQP
jgi:hypothetical protein